MNSTFKPISNPIGRPPKYREEYCQMILDMGKEGCHVYEMAMRLDVSKECLYEWARKHPIFSDAFSRARQYSKAWLINEARNNMSNKCYQPKLTEWVGRFLHDFRPSGTVNLPSMREATTLKGKAEAVLAALSADEITPDEGRQCMETIKVALTIEQEEEIRPMMEKLQEMMEKK